MNDYYKHISGSEFDWFGRGKNGSIAMFSTAGEGYVPKSVVSCFEQHEHIFKNIDNPNWGSTNVWKFYSELGLFVFDWSLPGGPYVKQGSPQTSIAPKLEAQLTVIDELPEIDANFTDIDELDFSEESGEYIGGGFK